MLSRDEFITMSLDLNLFFLRIMKEHSFFLEIGFTPKNSNLATTARSFRMGFEDLLIEATNLANGSVSCEAINSNQFVTKYTIDAEKLTSFYTGIPFNTNLTHKETMLSCEGRRSFANENDVMYLNQNAYQLTYALANFKDMLLQDVLSCRIFTLNYPLLIEHILREASLYLSMLDYLNNQQNIMTPNDLIDQEVFWNRQMAEHAKFIAGLLDPTEETLINTARMFGTEFDELTEQSKRATQRTFDIPNVTRENISATIRLRDFKTAGTKGLLDCNIKSIIVPLLADHVLREANHYLCVMGVCE